MASVKREADQSAAAWRGNEIGGKSGLVRQLSEAEIAALEAMLVATADKATLDVRQEDFYSAVLTDLAVACQNELVNGRGAVIFSGLDINRYDEDGFTRVYWFLGQLIGKPLAQSERNDFIGYVRQEKDNPFRRGYITNKELKFHNDYHEVLALACRSKAAEGGHSAFASGLTVHNVLLEERPDLLEALYDGWYDGMYPYYRLPRPVDDVPPKKTPYFGSVDGKLTLHAVNSMLSEFTVDELGMEISPQIKEALQLIFEIGARPDVGVTFTLEPGEMIFWHNWTVLHSRTAFENGPGQERVMIRLWMDARLERPTPDYVRQRAKTVDKIHQHFRAEAAKATA